jgi:HK97 family phage major capsid protein
MSKLNELRERKAILARNARNMMENKGDQRWTAEDQTKYDGLVADIEGINNEINNLQRLLDAEADAIFNDITGGGNGGQAAAAAASNAKKNVAAELFNKWMRNGPNALTSDDWAVVRNTMSTTTPAEGGYTVQQDIATSFIDAMAAFGGMREAANVIRTAGGNPLSYPTTDGTTEEGEIVPENTQAGTADVSFGTRPLNVFKFGSKVVTVPLELLQDSSIDVISLVNNRLATRIGRVTTRKQTVGTGTGEPMGLVTAASVGKIGATGSTLTVAFDDLIDLQESVDEAYQPNASWMFAQSTRKVVRKLKDGNGRPIWTPGYESGITKGTPDELLGKPVKSNSYMPAMAANAKPIWYGDLKSYSIRDAMDITLFRFTDSIYAQKGQVGFLAWMRSGGNLMDLLAGKVYQNSAT